jgi:hypothetical protein
MAQNMERWEKRDLRMMIWQTKLRKENPMHADTHKPIKVRGSRVNGGSLLLIINLDAMRVLWQSELN